MLRRALLPAGEVGLVLALFLVLRDFLSTAGFSAWQKPLFGAALVSSSLLFFVLPLLFVLLSGRDPGSCGLSRTHIDYHWRVARRAISYVMPAAVLFPVIGLLGSDYEQWLGATILTLGFIGAGLLLAARSQDLPNRPPDGLPWRDLRIYVLLLIVGLLLSAMWHPWLPLVARIFSVVIFIGFLEEFFFRGYVQSRLNSGFGKPFRFQGVEFGPGLLLAALAFGLFHPLTVDGEAPWPWALWTTAGGLVFGFLREKTGAVISPAMLHGAFLLPVAFLGPG